MQMLEKYFDTAFDAPDGIKKLRELILTLAMQGKLVPQDPNDQPASELLKEIGKEKNQLIKEKKIKKIAIQSEIKIEKIDFRNKERFGWSDHWETVTINGKEHDSQVYMKMFYEHTFLREACYVCPYKNLQRISDISIADAWGVEAANPEFDDNRGVSLVLINTQKGEKWFLDSLQGCDFKECALEKYMQEPLKGPFKKPDNTENVWKEYNEVSFGKFVKNHYKEPFCQVLPLR